MLCDEKIKEAESNVKKYLAEGLLKKQTNETAKEMYIENSDLSLETAQKLLSLETQTYKPYLWIIVSSYYSMYYIANAVLLNIGYKVGDKISHKITADALIVFARNKLKKGFIEEYELASNKWKEHSKILSNDIAKINEIITKYSNIQTHNEVNNYISELSPRLQAYHTHLLEARSFLNAYGHLFNNNSELKSNVDESLIQLGTFTNKLTSSINQYNAEIQSQNNKQEAIYNFLKILAYGI